MSKSYIVIFKVAPSQIQTLYFSMKLPWKKQNLCLEEELLHFVIIAIIFLALIYCMLSTYMCIQEYY